MRVVEAVKNVQKKTGYYGSDMFKLAKILNINIAYKDLGATLAFYILIKRIPYIILNEKLNTNDTALVNSVLAHEIGHHVLKHKKIAFNRLMDADYEEGEANKFAAELLMPTEVFLDTLQYTDDIYETAREFCVLPDLVVFKLNHLKKAGVPVPDVCLNNYNSFLKTRSL